MERTPEKTERNARVYEEYLAGSGYIRLGQRFGISPTRARQIVVKEKKRREEEQDGDSPEE